jgi:hypothetical protein
MKHITLTVSVKESDEKSIEEMFMAIATSLMKECATRLTIKTLDNEQEGWIITTPIDTLTSGPTHE